ncbi:asparagine synthase [Fictibacillus iocasae]|uniref:Asparagine synthase n=1 Tax=Fictibacillus iocasae TaxID=2715437 RepID=A0ABW2NLD1_9BACL
MLKREGLIPVLLGTIVSLSALPFLNSGSGRKKSSNSLTSLILGFGLAHIVLGTIDLFEHDSEDDHDNW